MSPIIGSIGSPSDTARVAWADAVAATYAQLRAFGSYRSAARHLSTLTGASVEKCRLALRRYSRGAHPKEHYRRQPICSECKAAITTALTHLLDHYPTKTKDTP